jgi:hypothetical protein
MATTVGPNPDILGDEDGTYYPPRKPVETPASAVKYTSTKMEFEMYEEVKRLAKILVKVGNFLYHGKNKACLMARWTVRTRDWKKVLLQHFVTWTMP